MVSSVSCFPSSLPSLQLKELGQWQAEGAQLLTHVLWVSVLAALPPGPRPEGQKGASEESGLAEGCPLPQIFPHFPKAAPAANGPCEY